MKGILLAGGRGTRLYPVTRAVSKQLLPIYDKPMFFYPLCTLMAANIRDILLIAVPADIPLFCSLLGNGSQFGIKLRYAPQPQPLGIADALRIAGDHFKGERMALILGDNLFIGDMRPALNLASSADGAAVFVSPVDDPQNFGVAEVEGCKVVSLEEKPTVPKSNLAVPGLYFYPPDATDIAYSLSPSLRGELEITDVNLEYMRRGMLTACSLPSGVQWLDTGTCGGLLKANNLAARHRKSGGICGCVEQTAYKMGYIDQKQLAALISGTDISKLTLGEEA